MKTTNIFGFIVLFTWLFILFIASQNWLSRFDLIQPANEVIPPISTNPECVLDSIQWSTGAIILTIAKLETNLGTTGVGLTHHNLTGLRTADGYMEFADNSDSIYYSETLWDENYRGISICKALAKWKMGDKNNRDEATIRYINNFVYLNQEAFNLIKEE